MRDLINILTESTVSKTMMTRDIVKKIAGDAQSRFDMFRPDMKIIGEISDNSGQAFAVWGIEYPDGDARFYVGNTTDRCVGYILLRRVSPDWPKMRQVSMVFIMPKFTRKGIAKALYRFILKRDYVLVSDETLTAGSRAIWASLMTDPDVEVTMTRSIHDMHEEPLNNITRAFRDKRHRLIAKMKNLLEYREAGLSTFDHQGHRYNLNKLFDQMEGSQIVDFLVDDLKWVLEYDDADPERVAKADITCPILVTQTEEVGEMKLVVVDGLHRLAKAVEEGIETLPGRFVLPENLEDCDLTVLIAGMRKRLAKYF